MLCANPGGKLFDQWLHRQRNFALLTKGLKPLEDKIILPKATEGSNPSWFGFLITIKESSGIKREDFIRYLTGKKIETRLLFGGDIRKQPYFKNIEHRTSGTMENTTRIMNNTFWIGVTPMINDEMIEYVISAFQDFLKEKWISSLPDPILS